ncbi:MAG: DUF4388 domain-containing protein [Planctomycetes bacterium]|nr:DUF4388 domain-containing protein [Planctomycetota bacterium]
MRILIVDRVWGQRQKIRGWLVQGGYSAPNVLESEDGVAALELLKSLDFSVDTVICDWEDPRVDGPTLAAEVRRLAGASVDFIAAGEFDAARRAGALARGAADAINRPIRPELLLQKLVALEKKRQQGRKVDPSQTSRFRLMQADAPVQKPAPLAPHLWEVLRRTCRHLEVGPGLRVPCEPANPRLWWIERGSVFVRETRDDGIEVGHRAGPEDFFGELAFGGGAYRNFEAATEEPTWLAWQDAETVRRITGEHSILFYYLRNLANTRARLYSRSGLPVEKGLSGTLESLKILDLLQMLHAAKRTGILRLDGPGRTAFLQFAGGQIIHAESHGEIGEKMVYLAMSWTRGQFEFYVGPETPGLRSVSTDMMKLLMEGAALQSGAPAP